MFIHKSYYVFDFVSWVNSHNWIWPVYQCLQSFYDFEAVVIKTVQITVSKTKQNKKSVRENADFRLIV